MSNDDQHTIDFDGGTYERKKDLERLTSQLGRVRAVMISGEWRTLVEIERLAAAPQASVSARLRDLRKDKFGGYEVHRRRLAGTSGLHQYSLHLRGCECDLCETAKVERGMI